MEVDKIIRWASKFAVILFACLFFYVWGYRSGLSRAVDDLRAWEEMYDRHIDGMREQIAKRDSVINTHFLIIYADGHTSKDSVSCDQSQK